MGLGGGTGEIERAPQGFSVTKRFVSEGAEQELFYSHTVDSHGTIELVDYQGGDGTVERVATAGAGRGVFPENPDRELFFEHLIAKGITEPFTSVLGRWIIRSPIETALDLVYPTSVSLNETSLRYSEPVETFHLPTVDAIAGVLKGERVEDRAAEIQRILLENREKAFAQYGEFSRHDFARELSRSVLGVDQDTKYAWKINLLQLARLVRNERLLRGENEHTRAYVEALAASASQIAPDAWTALMENDPVALKLTHPRDDAIADAPLAPAGWSPAETRRVTVPALESRLFVPDSVLDHGAIQPVDYMGNDESIAQAARTSYDKGTKTLQDDFALVRSLVRDRHTSPLEQPELATEQITQVFSDPRQAKRHRTLDAHGFMGEIVMGSKPYVPADDQLKYQDRLNRQGRGKDMDPDVKVAVLGGLQRTYDAQLARAEELRALGAPERLVRRVKGVGFNTKGWRTGDVHNWAHFLSLRNDPHAQHEVRAYAQRIADYLALQVPEAMGAYQMYKFDAVGLSTKEVGLMQGYLGSVMQGFDLNDLDNFKGVGFVVKKRDKDGSLVVNDRGQQVYELSREGQAFRNKLTRLLGR
ncbi:MAG: FAD-dependent thymidylate synthase [Nanoarchaeota archaeon]|nr:FAD-dependent thymidylate synthase [Nanoarchaeota archaeon]